MPEFTDYRNVRSLKLEKSYHNARNVLLQVLRKKIDEKNFLFISLPTTMSFMNATTTRLLITLIIINFNVPLKLMIEIILIEPPTIAGFES